MTESPTDRFVEAMRQFRQMHNDWMAHEDLGDAFVQAVEAFADATVHGKEQCCDRDDWCFLESDLKKIYAGSRAALLKRVMK